MVQKITNSWFKNNDLDFFQDATNYWEPQQQDRHNPPSIHYVTIPTPTQECTNCVSLIMRLSFVGVWHYATLLLSECKCLT